MKRALIITYYWPPAGGPGVQRWLKFVTYFREFGIEPVVYIPKNPHYPVYDPSFVAEIPEGIEILSHPISEPYQLAGLFSKSRTKQISRGIISKTKPSFLERALLFIRGNFFIPDARIGWVSPSVRFLENYLSEIPVDVIITTGPPHSLHLIGLHLKNKSNCKWVADFRDPWTTIHYHDELRLTESAKRKHKKLEKEVLTMADTIVVTSPTTKKEFQQITKKPIEVITNGYDFSEIIERKLDNKFTIAHIGSFLSERNPMLLWKALSEVAAIDPQFKTDLELKFAGLVSEEVVESIRKYGLSENLNLLGYLPHTEALQLQHNAQLLLLVEIDRPETKAIIPGKLFEYLAAERPIMAFGPEGSDISRIISETNSGTFLCYVEESSIKLTIQNYYEQFKNKSLEVDSSKITNYSRRELTSKMAVLLKKI